MKTIIFVTGNSRKLDEAIAGCVDFDIKIEQVKLQIDEIQSPDTSKISLHKANSAFQITKKPIVVSDTSWNIPSLNGFPGGYMKDVADWFTADDFINLIKGKKDKRVCFTESIVYKDKNQIKVFKSDYWGEFSMTPKGTGNSIEQIAIFNGYTIGERRDQGKLLFDPKDYIWTDFAKWFSQI